jgi:hypothetical protein
LPHKKLSAGMCKAAGTKAGNGKKCTEKSTKKNLSKNLK